ncbi:MAG: hypothetical protein A2599_01410 [Candidatus Staskawiczbacteria bacterium RIFOXYD1_FULL_39_28]|uniref:Uncharacterized protein n=1 Tax=Candidatus Staskawiczbacteria bacterium RIFOXYC1_FULL_38_18 TaxID=1802229 RepID=A0A1G2JC55_9BACT|nr:MAG: hypothetical protein A2401_01875 [Candidatus Staskawiczbacteria bacterium RIFOXYC1_FULL_38_18]OGZ92270.1 MAG: hypothetical protein A2599_01410 [Candidatus Staskawiczbacteria bacterium RIFOXYD1_FULL_39_28]
MKNNFMAKEMLTPKRAQEIQNEIFSNMPSEKKIRLTSKLFVITKKLKESKTVSNGTSRIISKNS